MGYGGILSGLVQGYGQAVIGNEKRQYEEKQKQKQNDLAMYQNMLATAQSPEQAAWAWQKYDEIAHGTGGKASSKPSLLGGIGKLIFGGGGQQQSQQGAPGGQQPSAAPQAPAQPVNPPGSAPTAGQPQPGMAVSPGLPVSTTPVVRPQLTPPLPPRQQAQAGQQQGLTPPGAPNFAAWQASADARTAALEKQKSDSAIATYGAERGIDESNTAKREERQAKQQADTVKVLRQAGREADIADFIERKKTAESILGHPLSDEQNTQSLNTFLGIKKSGGEKILGANISGKDIPDGTVDIYGKPINKSNTYRKVEQDGEFKGYQPVETAGSKTILKQTQGPDGRPIWGIFDKQTGQYIGKSADVAVGDEMRTDADGNPFIWHKTYAAPSGGGAKPPQGAAAPSASPSTPPAAGASSRNPGLTPPLPPRNGSPAANPGATPPTTPERKGAGKLTADGVDFAAEELLQTHSMVSLGMKSPTERSAIINRAAELQKERGGSLSDVPTQQALFKAQSATLQALLRQKGLVGAYEKTTQGTSKILLDASSAVDRTGSPLVNRYLLYLKGDVKGDADTLKLQNAVRTQASEYAKIMGGGTGAASSTDSVRAEAEKSLNAAFSKNTMKAVLDQMNQEIQQRNAGFDGQIAETMKSMRGSPARPKPSKPGQSISKDQFQKYLDMTGGDVAEAKKLFTEDGWTAPGPR